MARPKAFYIVMEKVDQCNGSSAWMAHASDVGADYPMTFEGIDEAMEYARAVAGEGNEAVVMEASVRYLRPDPRIGYFD